MRSLVGAGAALGLVLAWSSPALAAGPAWGWPLQPRPAVVRPFEPPAGPYSPGHRGVDLAGAPGSPVLAAGAGTVTYAGILAGRGVVSVTHPGGLRTTYEPLLVTVRAGDEVGPGSKLGTLSPGHVGCPVSACLHWGLLRGSTYLDPLFLLPAGPVRLLPLSSPPPAPMRAAPTAEPAPARLAAGTVLALCCALLLRRA